MEKQKEKTIKEPNKAQAIAQVKTQEHIQAKKPFEERQPTMDRKIMLSKDKKRLIIRTIRTDIVHVNYMEKILGTGEAQ